MSNSSSVESTAVRALLYAPPYYPVRCPGLRPSNALCLRELLEAEEETNIDNVVIAHIQECLLHMGPESVVCLEAFRNCEHWSTWPDGNAEPTDLVKRRALDLTTRIAEGDHSIGVYRINPGNAQGDPIYPWNLSTVDPADVSKKRFINVTLGAVRNFYEKRRDYDTLEMLTFVMPGDVLGAQVTVGHGDGAVLVDNDLAEDVWHYTKYGSTIRRSLAHFAFAQALQARTDTLARGEAVATARAYSQFLQMLNPVRLDMPPPTTEKQEQEEQTAFTAFNSTAKAWAKKSNIDEVRTIVAPAADADRSEKYANAPAQDDREPRAPQKRKGKNGGQGSQEPATALNRQPPPAVPLPGKEPDRRAGKGPGALNSNSVPNRVANAGNLAP